MRRLSKGLHYIVVCLHHGFRGLVKIRTRAEWSAIGHGRAWVASKIENEGGKKDISFWGAKISPQRMFVLEQLKGRDTPPNWCGIMNVHVEVNAEANSEGGGYGYVS